MIKPIAYMMGIDLAKNKDISVYGNGSHTASIDELHGYSTREEAREALINMDRQVIHDVMNKEG
ncbi:hypothetical protein D3C74_201090 [compost metagenome]